ncbi:MAG: efflux RND transporter periplasmic adaptor subunit [Fibrobacterales bacterium]
MNKRVVTGIICGMIALSYGVEQYREDAAHGDDDDHAGHAHEKTEVPEQEENHSDDGHAPLEEGVISLTAEGEKMIGLTLKSVTEREITTIFEIPGEIVLNQERLTHVTPRFSGVIRETNKEIGAFVKKGEVLATVENNETFTRYTVKAPMSGRIIEKHASVGEYASEETTLFVVADLSTVWVDFKLFPKQLRYVPLGTQVSINTIGSQMKTTGSVRYISPLLNPETRTGIARILLRNRKGQWRPGMFVQGTIEVKESAKTIVVHNSAIQLLDEEMVVFAPAKGGYKAHPVKLGRRGVSFTEVVSGIEFGDTYVVQGAFDLKAAVVTQSLSGHAGHGH